MGTLPYFNTAARSNRYVFQPFWDYQNRRIDEAVWRLQFGRSRSKINRALGSRDTKKVIAVLFGRLYVLRNQLVHGGATWGSSVNREQVRDGAQILGFVVPLVVDLMMSNPNELWGEPCFPVVF